MKRLQNWLILLCALLMLGAIGCAEEPEVETSTAAAEAPATETTAAPEVPGLPDGSEPVQVVLTSFGIDMPSTLPSGTTVLTVSNEADTEHNLEIEGQGVEMSFEENLQGGEVKTMEVDLVPGEYRVYCPVGDHAAQGMEMTLTVEQGEATTSTQMDGMGQDESSTDQ